MEEILVKLFEAHDELNMGRKKRRSVTMRTTQEIEFRKDGKADKNLFKKIDKQLVACEENLHRIEHMYENPAMSDKNQWMFNTKKNKSIKNFFN